MMSEWIVSILLLIGGCFILIGSIGLVKMPDFFMRLHGPTKATNSPSGIANEISYKMFWVPKDLLRFLISTEDMMTNFLLFQKLPN